MAAPLADPAPLRLYLWRGVLHDYTAGMAFAIASSADEARGMICRQVTESAGYFDGSGFAKEPEVRALDEPFAAFVEGGG